MYLTAGNPVNSFSFVMKLHRKYAFRFVFKQIVLKTDVTLAILSRNFGPQLYRAKKSQVWHGVCRATLEQLRNTTTSIGEAVKTFGTEFWIFYHKGSFFSGKNAKIAKNISRSCNFRVEAVTTPQWLQMPKPTAKCFPYGMSSFHFYR